MNTLVYGFNNIGKTERIIVPNVQKIIDNNESLLFLDTNVEYYPHFKQKLLDQGYQILLLNFKKLEQSNSWNPLSLPYYYFSNNKQICIQLLKNMGNNIFNDMKSSEEKEKCVEIFVGLALILFSYARVDAINLFSLNSLLKHEGIFGMTLTTLEKGTDEFHYLAQILSFSGENIFEQFRQHLNKYVLYENLSNLLSYNDYNLENIINDKIALFVINKPENKYINNLVNTYIDQVYQMVKHGNSFNFVLDNLENIENISALDDILQNKYNINVLIGINDIELYKHKYSLKGLDIIYNLDDDGSVIKVEKTEKRKYKYDNYPKTKLSKTVEYPILEVHPKFLFNLTNYINRMKGI